MMIEAIAEPLIMTATGFLMKRAAENQANYAENFGLALKGLGAHTETANESVKRGGPAIRRWILGLIFLVMFGGVLFAMFGEYTTSYMYLTEVKEHIFGLFHTGGKMKTIEAKGYVLTPENRRICIDAAFFLFGSGIAKQRK